MALLKAPHPERARSAQSKDVQRRSSPYDDTCPTSLRGPRVNSARTRGPRQPLGPSPDGRPWRAVPGIAGGRVELVADLTAASGVGITR
jgi:hypothetical protein